MVCGASGALPTPHHVKTFHLANGREIAYSLGDITKWTPPSVWRGRVRSSALVNAANERCLGGGGVDGAIHRSAGPELRTACEALPQVEPGVRCPTGSAVATLAFGDLRTTHVIHCVGPNVSGRSDVGAAATDPALLRQAYNSALRLARELECATVAFPAISCGVFGYDPQKAASEALDAILEHPDGDPERIDFVLYSEPTLEAFATVFEERLG